MVGGGRGVSDLRFGLLAAGMRVLNPGWSAWPSCLDVFVSSKLMPRVDCPVLVMHVSSCMGLSSGWLIGISQLNMGTSPRTCMSSTLR